MNGDLDAFRKLDAIKSAEAKKILARPGVTGVAVGYRTRGGALTSEPVIIVYVEKKKPREMLGAQDVIELDGAPIDIQEHGPMVAQYLRMPRDQISAQDSSPHRPLTGGIEIGPTGDHFVGTLGAILYDTASHQPTGLTNWHVAAGSTTNPVGRDISQPGNGATAKIGRCVRAVRGPGGGGDVDAAAISLDPGVPYALLQEQTIGTINGVAPAAINQSVVKQGRTSNRTTGRIAALGWTGNVNYDGTLVHFTNQILIEPVGVPAASLPGDSGSVWLSDPAHVAIGLNFAGDGHVAIANPIAAVLAAVGVTASLGASAFYRWFNPSHGDHFYTEDPSGELAPVSGYVFEGVGCRLFTPGTAGTTALHRWYRSANGDHFYTTDPAGELAPQSGYAYEGVAGHVATGAAPGRVAWNRWFSPHTGDHFYTTDPNGELAPQGGYVSEGVTGWVLPA